MKNWARVVSKRGYPYRFKSLGEFSKFGNELLDGLSRAGVRTDDVRVQGTSPRNLNAMKTGIINSKGPIVAPLNELAASLASRHPDLNIETVSILLKGCLFDMTPDLPVKRH